MCEKLGVVVGGGDVFVHTAARLTAIHDLLFSGLQRESDGLHDSMTSVLPISWIDVHMKTREAHVAMVARAGRMRQYFHFTDYTGKSSIVLSKHV